MSAAKRRVGRFARRHGPFLGPASYTFGGEGGAAAPYACAGVRGRPPVEAAVLRLRVRRAQCDRAREAALTGAAEGPPPSLA